MPTAQVLRDRRDRARLREAHVEKLIREQKIDLNQLAAEIGDERDERAHLTSKRKDFGEAIEAEIKADLRGRGEHPAQWEAWAQARRDELADLIDGSEARIDRLIESIADTRAKRSQLRRLDSKLEKRIDRLELRIERKAEASGQLTDDFHVVEFDCHDGTPVPPGIIPDLRDLCVQHLQPLRDSGGSVHINSGFRTAAYNASIGGAIQSYHIYDLRMAHPAADHIQAGRSASAVQAWHEAHNPFDGMGFYPGFTHGDDRGYPSRWYGAA